MGTYRFPFDPRSLLALLALAWLASFLHEFVHHAAGALVCGEVGRMSLSLFALDAGCGPDWPWTTVAGPALSYLLMWLGMALVAHGRHVWWGFALVIANKPLLRLATALAGGGDEGVLWDLWSPAHGRWLASAMIALLSLPPLFACWRALVPRHRALVMTGALLLPLLPVLPVPFLDRGLYGDWIAGREALPSAFGVPWSMWALETAVGAALLALIRFAGSPATR